MPQDLTERPEEAPESVGTFRLSTLVRICWRGKWLLVLGTLLGLGYGLRHYLGEPPIYQSSTQVLVVKKKQSEALPVPRMDYSYLEDYLSEHVVLIKSPLIIGRAVQSSHLQSLRSFAGQDDPTYTIIGALSITRDTAASPLQSNHILTLSYSGGDPEDCRAVLNAVLESYRQFLEETYRSVGDDTVKLITEARNVLQKDLARKAKDYEAFRQKAPLLSRSKDGSTIHQETLTSLQSARSALLLRKAKVQGQLNALEKVLQQGQSPEVVLASLLSDGNERKALAALQRDLAPLLAQEKELLQSVGPGHPNVQAVRYKIDAIRELATRPGRAWSQEANRLSDGDYQLFIKTLIESTRKSLKQELESIELEENSFSDLSNTLEDEARRRVNYEIQDEALKSDTLRTQQLYDSVLQRLNEVNLIKDMGGFNTQIVFPPEPGVQQPTKVVSKILTATIFGLLGGFVLAYGANFFDRSFHSPEEIRRRLGVPVVGHIPQLQTAVKPPRSSSFLPFSSPGKGVEAKGGNSLDPLLCTYHRPRSRQTEAFRGVRTALYFNARGAGPKVLQITSPDVGDGKTTLAANLAVCIAQSGKTVLLIDADFRLGRLHTVFGLSPSVGLANILAGKATLSEAIQASVVPGLFVLAAGAVPPNPAELLTSPRFKELLDQLRVYDFVLVDTPPLLAVTDPSVVASHVDGVLLVVRTSRKSDGPNAERSMEMLSALGAQVMGVVVNGVNPAGRFGAYTYRSYGYGNAYASTYDSSSGTNAPTDHPKKPPESKPRVVRPSRDTLMDHPRPSS